MPSRTAGSANPSAAPDPHAAGQEGLSLEPVAPFVEPAHQDYRDRVAAFCRDCLRDRPDPETDADARVRARRLVRLMGDADLYAPIANGDVRACLVARELLAWWSPLADAVFALQALSATPALLHDRDADARRWAQRALAGRAMGAFAMTEREAGSDVASMTTQAVRETDGAGYRLTGRKAFVSNAGIADFYVVFAKTPPQSGKLDLENKKSGRPISCFVVSSDKKGVVFVKPFVMSAPHPLGEVRFDDCRVPASARLGPEGGGLKTGLATLDRLRPTVAAAACGMAGRALWEAVRHARSRRQFGAPLGSFQLIRQKLAASATELDAARLLAYRAAWKKDQGAARITQEAAMAKSFATEAAQRIVDRAVQVLGGRGVMADHPLDRLYRSVRALRIYEGTTEIQQLIVGRALVKEDRA